MSRLAVRGMADVNVSRNSCGPAWHWKLGRLAALLSAWFRETSTLVLVAPADQSTHAPITAGLGRKVQRLPWFGSGPAGSVLLEVVMPSVAEMVSGVSADTLTPTAWAVAVDASRTVASATVAQCLVGCCMV